MQKHSQPNIQYFNQWKHLDCNVSTWQQEPCFNHGRARAIQALLGAGGSVLDVGCGVCNDSPHLRAIPYHGLDVTRKFLVEAHSQGNVDCTHASGLHLPFRDNSFATVYIKDVLVHLPPGMWKILLREAFRVASNQVVTLEGQWLAEQDITQMESYDATVQGKKVKLRFYNNGYYGAEVVDYARSCGAKQIKYYMHKTVNWQLTIYRL